MLLSISPTLSFPDSVTFQRKVALLGLVQMLTCMFNSMLCPSLETFSSIVRGPRKAPGLLLRHKSQGRARTTNITGFYEGLGLGGPFDEAFNLEFSFSTLSGG